MSERKDIDIFNIEKRNKELNNEQLRVRRKYINDIREILKLPAGRRFFWAIWEKAGIFRDPFTPNSNQTAKNCGRMDIGREVLADVNEADWTAFAKIQQEYVSAANSKKEANNA